MTYYNAEDYWGRLLADEVDARTVGYPELPLSFNLAAHEAGRQAVRRAVVALDIDVSHARVLDVGAGSGLWVDFWQREGAVVAAEDLTEHAAQTLRTRFPGMRIAVADIASSERPGSETYDIVSAMNVLLHITDPNRVDAALANLASLVTRGGHLILMEPAVRYRWWRPTAAGATARTRTLVEWQRLLDAAGFNLVRVEPTTALLSSVVDTKHRVTFEALWLYWTLLTKAISGSEVRGRVVARLLRTPDRALVRATGWAPSGKCLVAIRRAV